MNTYVRDNQDAAFPDAVSSVSWSASLEASTDPDLGDGDSTTYRYIHGALERVWAQFYFDGASMSPGSGNWFVTLPSTVVNLATPITAGSNGTALGTWRAFDNSNNSNNENGVVYLASSTTIRFARGGTSGVVSDASPFTWAAGDVFTFEAEYPIA